MGADRSRLCVRESVALFPLDHLACLQVSGRDAFKALDRVCARDLTVRDTRMLQTLLLDERALPIADVLVGRDDKTYFLLLDGLGAPEAMEHLRAHLPAGVNVDLEDLGATHRLLSLSGPFAWELMAALLGRDAVELPFLSFARLEHFTVFRTGRTGEYGYDLLVPRAEAAALEARLLELGARLGITRLDLAALDQCALESWQFNARREGRSGMTPIELQQQWRVSYRKDYVGAAALKERRAQGPRCRLTALVGGAPIAAGDPVTLGDRPIGQVVNAGFSEARGDHVALALIDLPYAHPGIDRFTLRGAPIRTVAPPFIDNRSVYVNPQRDTFDARGQIAFPPLAVTSPR